MRSCFCPPGTLPNGPAGADHPVMYPGSSPPANDDLAIEAEIPAAEVGVTARNEPENPPEALSDEPDTAAAALTPLQQAIRAELDSLVASGEEEPDLTRLTQLTHQLCLPQRRAG